MDACCFPYFDIALSISLEISVKGDMLEDGELDQDKREEGKTILANFYPSFGCHTSCTSGHVSPFSKSAILGVHVMPKCFVLTYSNIQNL